MSPVEKYWDGTQYVPILGGMTQGAADARYVLKSGDTMTGNLGIDRPAASGSQFVMRADGVNRWVMGRDGSSNFTFQRYDASGNFLGYPITMATADGLVSIPNLAASATGVITPVGVWGDVGGGYVGLLVTKVGPMVTIEGTMKPSSSVAFTAGTVVTIGTIPAGLRPAHTMFGPAQINTGTAMVAGGLHVDWTGNVQAYSNSAATITTGGSIGFSLTYRQGN